MTFHNNESGQSGLLIFVILGVFIFGIIYVLLSPVMDAAHTINNGLISNTSLPYTQGRWDMMNSIFLYWWAFPIYMIALFIIYGIKKAIDKQSGVI